MVAEVTAASRGFPVSGFGRSVAVGVPRLSFVNLPLSLSLSEEIY